MKATWWGHATVTIEDRGYTVLTDPLLRDRVGHLHRRRGVTPVPRSRPDAVLISHLHADHCDVASLRRLAPDIRLVVPRGAAGFLRHRLGERDIVEVVAGDEVTVGGLRVRAVPAHHPASRGALSRLRAAPVGYLISGTRTAWFAGDTGLFDAMAELSGVDLALVPVWGWGWSLGEGHLDPESAAQALLRVRPAVAVPIHWGTLWPIGCGRVRPDRFTEPGAEFARYAARVGADTSVRVLDPGASTTMSTAGLAAP